MEIKLLLDVLCKAAPGLVEDLGIHELQVGRNLGLEVHIGENVLLKVDAGSDFDKGNLVVDELEYAALGDVKNDLILACILTGEGDLLYLVDELADLALFKDLQLAVAGLQLGLAHEGAAEKNLGSSLSDVDEAAGAGHGLAQETYVVVTVYVNFAEAEAGHVKAAAVNEVEHIAVVNAGVSIVCGTEVGQSSGYAADHAALGAHNEIVNVCLFVNNLCGISGDTNTEVDDITLLEFHCNAAADNLALVEGKSLDSVEGLLDLAGESGLIVETLGLPASILIGSLNNIVNHDAGNLYILGSDGALLAEVLYLDDNDTAGVLGSCSDSKAFVDEAFVLKSDIAVLISGGTTEESNVYLEALVEQVLFTLEVYQLNQVIGSGFVHLTTLNAGVNEGTETNLGQQTGTTGCDFTPKVNNNALRQAVALQLVLKSEVTQSERAADVSAGPAGNKAGACFAETGSAAGLPVAHGAGLLQVHVAGMTGFFKSVADGAGNFLRPTGKTHAADTDCSVVGNKGSGFLGGNKFCHNISSLQ